MNLVLLTGHLGQKPIVHDFANGKVVRFSLATNSYYKDKEGITVEKTEWHNIVASGNVANTIEKYLDKGSFVAIQGKLTTRNYDNSVQKKVYVTEVRISQIEFLDKKKDSQPAPVVKDDNEDDHLPF